MKAFYIFAGVSLILIVIVFSGTKKIITGTMACKPVSFESEIITNDLAGVWEGKKIEVPQLTLGPEEQLVLGLVSEERWIEIDLSEQRLRAWEGSGLFLESLVSTGLPWWATPTGEYRVWAKVRATKMEGGQGRYYYNLPNVPYVMFFENKSTPAYKGFSLHGTYWHNDFGRVHSHGCVNLPTSVSEMLYYWTGPVMPEGKRYVRASEENPGTKVVIHE